MKYKMRNYDFEKFLDAKIITLFSILAVFLVASFFYLYPDVLGEKSFLIDKSTTEDYREAVENNDFSYLPKSSISGLTCENYNLRPFAVMLAEDSVARPLSGISMADLVVEMPVITDSITRMMAVFQCESPEEIGSVRSARHDFIPLAAGFDAIFVHWGGSHYALSELKTGILDNIDALSNPFSTFYRKYNIPAPHNGFTSTERILNTTKKLNYQLITDFEGYKHRNFQSENNSQSILEIGYKYPYNIKYIYYPETNSYLRWRGSLKEIDKLTNKQVEVKNIVIMRAKSRQIEGQYNDVDVEGTGEAVYYLNGQEYKGYWQKDKLNIESKLYFFDENDEEIEFVPGNIWIEIVEPYQRVTWSVATI